MAKNVLSPLGPGCFGCRSKIMFKSTNIQSKLQTQAILAQDYQGSRFFRQMFWLPASSSVLNCFSILLLFTFIAQSFKIKAGIIVLFLLPWCIYVSFSRDLSYSLHIQNPRNRWNFHTASCKHAGYWSCVQALSWVAGKDLPYKLPCFPECDTWHPAHLSIERQRVMPDLHSLMLQCAMAQPARQSECWYQQHQSCFLPEVKGEQGRIYVLHRVQRAQLSIMQKYLS